MNNMYDETNKFSMADDSDDYDEYEEEVIERDEEYDDEDDEEYDDEEYDDEEYDDEDYEEEEPEEEYDDGYDDQYYDDRLNQVLDELAELKRGMAPPAVQQPLGIQPHVLFTMPQQNSNEVVMYNEISRLRDELSKTQNEQSMHLELSRMKEDMERDKRQNEAQFLSEIKRLNERIEELQQPEKAKPALGSSNGSAGYLPEPAPSKELGKLVTVNENMLKTMRDADNKIASEIADVKNKLSSMLGGRELEKALSDLREAVKVLEERPVEDNSEALEKISESIAALKTSVEESGGSSSIDPKLITKLARAKSDSKDVDLTEIMRSVYELKGMLGSSDASRMELVNMALKAYTDLDLLYATINNSTDFRMKLEAVENFVSSVNAQDFITSDVLGAYNIVLKNLLDTPLDRNVFDSLCSFATATGKITITSSKKDAVNRYVAFADRAKREDIGAIIEFLPEMVTAINDAESSRNVLSNGSLYEDILSEKAELDAAESEADKHAAENEIRALLSELADLKVGDVVTYSPVMPLPVSEAVAFADGDSVSDRLNILMASVADLSAAVEALSGNAAVSPAMEHDDVVATVQPAAEAVDSGAVAQVSAELANLKDMIAALEAKVNVDDLFADMQRNFVGVANRLAVIEGRLSGVEVTEAQTDENAPVNYATDEIVAAVQDVGVNISNDLVAQANEIIDRIFEKLDASTDEESKVAMLEDLAAIKDKLAEQDMFITQIGDLRADILALPETLQSANDVNKLYDDLVGQFDKLFDDLSAVDADYVDKIYAKLDEVKAAAESVAASDLSSQLLDGIVDFRAAYEENQSLSAADRQKLLDDVAYVREQVEKRLGEQAEFSDNLKVLEEKIASLEVSDSDNRNSVIAAIDELKEKSAALEDAINTNGLLASENQTAISEDIARVLEQLTPPADSESAVNVYDEIVSIANNLEDMRASYEQANGDILNAIADVKEQVHLKELEQNLAAVTATEEEQKTLLSEIASLRERLSGLESAQTEQNDVMASKFDAISEKLAEIESSASVEPLNAVIESIDTRLSDYIASDSVTAANVELLLNDIVEIKGILESDGVKNLTSETVEEVKTLISDVAEIKEKLFRGASDDGALNMQMLMADVAEIKDRLNEGIDTTSEIVKMQDDITFIRNQIEANIDTVSDDDNINASLESEGMSLIMDDIAAIKDKLSAIDEYDTVNEIIALREDVKAARILDNNDVTAELEGLKGDLLELKADIADIKNANTDDGVAMPDNAIPTAEEVNMLLSEIVSLRDELQAYKDDVANFVNTQIEQTDEPATAVADENINVILDELTGLHNEIDGLKEESLAEQAEEINSIKASLSEIKDMISRRTTLIDDGAARDSAVSNELNVVLDEIVNVKDEVAALKNDFVTATENVAAERESDAQAEKAAFADEMQTLKSELYSLVSDKLSELTGLSPELGEELQSVKEQLADLQAIALGGVSAEGETDTKNDLLSELNEIKELLLQQTNVQETSEEAQPAVTIDDLYGEVLAMRQDMEEARLGQPVVSESGDISIDLNPINDKLAEISERLESVPVASEGGVDNVTLDEMYALREEIAAMREQMNSWIPVASAAPEEQENGLYDEVLALRDELAALREEIASGVPAAAAESEPDMSVLNEVLALRDELNAMREEIASGVPAAAAESEPDMSVLNEVLALRDELTAMREQMNTAAAPSEPETDSVLLNEILGLRDELERMRAGADDGLMESVDAIKEDVRAIKDEPDLSIINEVLALRDEFQAFKDELNKTRTAPQEDKSKEELVAEVQSLRDQIFAISMANVNDGTSSEVVYESYNNIILDEISSLRDEIALIKQSDETKALSEELSLMKDKLTNLAVDDSEKTEARFDELRNEIAALKRKDESDATNNAILGELAALKEELANQREADATTLNFMSEMAHLLERQNVYISQASNERLSDEIESLKSEIASSLAVPATSDDVRQEIESLKAELSKNMKSAPVAVDNSAVLEEIAALREELNRRNISEQPADDTALSRSINDLKAELNQLAGFVDETQETKPAAPRKTSSSKSGNKPRSKSGTKSGSGTKRKSPVKPAEKVSDISADSLLSKIDSVKIEMPESDDDNVLALNPDFVPENIPHTSEEMDIAARLAKQVANKLIMEQLVEQLGDVPDSEVEEIVKDILPQEFTTVQIDEQSDKVRRLANSLVLDKLRNRLKK